MNRWLVGSVLVLVLSTVVVCVMFGTPLEARYPGVFYCAGGLGMLSAFSTMLAGALYDMHGEAA